MKLKKEHEQLMYMIRNQRSYISDLEAEIFNLRNENRVAQANLELIFGP